jgi:hypothetical protein
MIAIVPHRGAGDISFGMTRAQVEQTVGQAPRRTKLSEFGLSETDFFSAFAVYYDGDDKCCAIEFRRGGLQVVYGGYELFAHPPDEVRAWARTRDKDLKETDGFVSTVLGLSMYAPEIDEPDLDGKERAEPAQSFLAFRPGYYEEERKRLKTRGIQT